MICNSRGSIASVAVHSVEVPNPKKRRKFNAVNSACDGRSEVADRRLAKKRIRNENHAFCSRRQASPRPACSSRLTRGAADARAEEPSTQQRADREQKRSKSTQELENR